MINILMSGCNGKMGQVISQAVAEHDRLKISAGYDVNDFLPNDYPVFTNLKEINVKVDVIIDFSNPDALESIVEYAVNNKIPLVMATTGLSSDQKSALKAASTKIPVFFSANMSLGVNLLIDLVKKAAKVLKDNFDIEIIEKHNNQKLDAPSGTALAIADAINTVFEQRQEYIFDRHSRRKKRSKNEIGIHAVRGGTIVGEHQVIFSGNDEIIEINHIAMSKKIFAEGALKAASFIHQKAPGIYGMNDLVAD
jgi:4-hydroxy-tetrahydrodipicolinate reductase